jgi:threonine dehydrogenase-like Zn-dependent dehydrogenase
MKAVKFVEPHKFSLVETSIPSPGENEILIKNKASGVCGTDVHIYSGDVKGLAAPGTVLGHEFAGIIEKVGPNVKGFSEGEHIAVEPNLYCGRCHYCRNAKKHFCENWKAVGLAIDGGFQEYTKIPLQAAYKMPKGLAFKNAAFFEPLACVLHGIERAHVSPGETVVLQGAGSIGLLYIQALKKVGATTIIVSEIDEKKQQLAKQFGATTVINPKVEPIKDVVMAETNGIGANVFIDAAGLINTIPIAIPVLENSGRIVIFGVPPEFQKIEISPYDIYRREIQIIGSFTNPYTNEAALKMLKEIDVDPIISHPIGLADLEESIKKIHNREPGIIKVQVQF